MADYIINGKLMVEGDGTIRSTLANYETIISGNSDLVNKKYVDDLVSGENLWDRNTGSGYLYSHTLTDRIGVGLNNPSEMLDVLGNINIPTTTSSVGQIKINGTRVLHSYGNYNLFIGQSCGNFTLTGSYNVTAGNGSLFALTSGGDNTALGYSALYGTTTGSSNSAFGSIAGQNITTGSRNMAFGYSALYDVNGGNDNVGVGWQSGASINGKSNNTAVGSAAIQQGNPSGAVAIGRYALRNDAGVGNIGIGYQAGDNLTGGAASYNIIIGYDLNASTNIVDHELNIGNALLGKTDQTAALNVSTYTDYETLVLADDDLPNKKYVDDAVGGVNLWSRDLINGYIYPTTLTDKIGIGTITPTRDLDVKASSAWNGIKVSYDGDVTSAAEFSFLKSRLGAAPSVDDWIGGFTYNIIDSASNEQGVGGVYMRVKDATDGTESAEFHLRQRVAGTLVTPIKCDANGVIIYGGTDTVAPATNIKLYTYQGGVASYRDPAALGAQHYGFYTSNAATGKRMAFYIFGNETGANTGGDFGISRYDDTGSWLGNQFYIKRATGKISIGNSSETFHMAFYPDNAVTIGQERTNIAGGNYFRIQSGGAKIGGTDLAGGSLQFNSGISTGSGAGGHIYINQTLPGVSGTADNAYVTTASIHGATGNLCVATNATTLGATHKITARDASPAAISIQSMGTTNGDTAGYLFKTTSDLSSGWFKGAILMERITAGADVKMHLALNNVADATNASVSNSLLTLYSGAAFIAAPSSASADANFANSQWSMSLDEVNDEFELKAKKSNGTIISTTIPSALYDEWLRNSGSGYVYLRNLTDSVGIGIAAPTSKLHVYNSGASTNLTIQTTTTPGTTDEARLNFNSGDDYTTLFYRDSDNTFGIYHGVGGSNVTRFRITGAGNILLNPTGQYVGIGTGTINAPTMDLAFGGDVTRTLGMERHSVANTAGNIFYMYSGGATSGATNKNSGEFILSTGVATGTGSGTIRFRTASPGSIGTTDNIPDDKMIISGDGDVSCFAQDATKGELYLHGYGSDGANHIYNVRHRRARGTRAVPTIVQTDDGLGSIFWQGYDGATYQNAANIYTVVKGTPAAGNIKGLVAISTGGGVTPKYFYFTEDGKFGVNNSTAVTSKITVRGDGITNATSSLNIADSADRSMLFVRDDGNVGIGTTTPSYQLTIAGASAMVHVNRFSDTDAVTPKCLFDRARGTQAAPTVVLANSDIGSFHFRAYNGVTYVDAGFMRLISQGDWTNAAGRSSDMIFDIYSAGSLTRAITLTNDSKCGIWTSAPHGVLDVKGSSTLGSLLSAPSAEVIDGDFDNSQWSLSLDEVNNEFELKAKTSTGAILKATIESSTSAPSIDDNVTLADDAIYALPASAGFGRVVLGDMESYADFYTKSDGTVAITVGSNSANTDTDTFLCIFNNAGIPTIKNRLGASKLAKISFRY